jgi:hypothetical protein
LRDTEAGKSRQSGDEGMKGRGWGHLRFRICPHSNATRTLWLILTAAILAQAVGSSAILVRGFYHGHFARPVNVLE